MILLRKSEMEEKFGEKCRQYIPEPLDLWKPSQSLSVLTNLEVPNWKAVFPRDVPKPCSSAPVSFI